MTVHNAVRTGDQVSVSSVSRNTSPSSATSAADDSATTMDDRTRSADYRRQVLVREGTMLRVSSEKSNASMEKKPTIGIRAMSAQDRSSLMIKIKMEDEINRLSEAKSRVIKGKNYCVDSYTRIWQPLLNWNHLKSWILTLLLFQEFTYSIWLPL